METRKYELPSGKIHTEKLVEEIKNRTGLNEVGLHVINGGTIEKTVIVNGKIESVVTEVTPGVEVTLSDSTKFGQALEVIQAHNPVKQDSEVVEDKQVTEFEEKLMGLPLIQKLIADVAALKGK